MRLRAWLRPGIGVKRWLAVVLLAEAGLALALALLLRQIYREVTVDGPVQAVVYLATLQFLPYGLRALVLGAAGGLLFLAATYRLVRALTDPVRGGPSATPLAETIHRRRLLARGPRIVAIGGGTGLSALLRGLKEQTSNLTAVVTVADDGGSSGKLRDQLGLPAVGDIRNCLVALADEEPLMERLLQYRFPLEGAPSELGGHAVGNLLIAALAAVEAGDFEEGVRQMHRVLAVRGRVVPVSPTPVVLHARRRDGEVVVGQSVIARTDGIERVWLTPDEVRPSSDAIRAIGEADLVVVGPGSLFTSILPNLLVPGVREALLATPALRAYVCNVATQPGETTGLDLADHVEALLGHTAPGIVDLVLANSRLEPRPPAEGAAPVALRWPPELGPGVGAPRLVLDEVVDPGRPHHHEPSLLAAALLRLHEREGRHRRGAREARSA